MTPADREAPRVWHHGLVARWWAEFNVGGPEVEHFGARLRELGGPTLDVGCGSGRLLVPFVKAGLEVEGCDVSADMLARCRARAGAEGVSVTLHRQAAQELDLPRRYRSAIMCGVLGLGGVRAHDQEALRRVYAHLEPGGTLLLDHHLPYASEEEWRYWTSAGQRELPLPWPAAGERRVAADGDELELTTRLVALDPLAQRATREVRVRLWRDGALVAQEERSLLEQLYLANEVQALLQEAGFERVTVVEGYSGAPATPASAVLVFRASRS